MTEKRVAVNIGELEPDQMLFFGDDGVATVSEFLENMDHYKMYSNVQIAEKYVVHFDGEMLYDMLDNVEERFDVYEDWDEDMAEDLIVDGEWDLFLTALNNAAERHVTWLPSGIHVIF